MGGVGWGRGRGSLPSPTFTHDIIQQVCRSFVPELKSGNLPTDIIKLAMHVAERTIAGVENG